MYLYADEIDRDELQNEILIDYFSIKDLNPDCVLLFQIGSFYELFFQDAKILSDITGITLTSRTFAKVGDIAQCGFPKSQNVNFYIKQLLDNNYKVCLCDELTDEYGKIRRVLKRKYTCGTILENELLDVAQNNYIAALRDNNTFFELAYADVSTGQFYKTKGDFNEIFSEIVKIEPSEVLFLKREQEKFDAISKKYNVTILDDVKYFNSSDEIIKKYCKDTQKDFCISFDEIFSYDIKKFLSMDEKTRKNLELTRTKMHLKKKGSLLWFLNNTKTPMGIRLLKKYLNEPLLNLENILERQNAVDEFIQNIELLSKIEKILDDFSDLSRICAKISNSTILPKDLYAICESASSLVELFDLLKEMNSEFLKLNNEKFIKILDFIKQIKLSIKKDANDEITQGNIIALGFDSNLDYLKDKLSDFEKQIYAYESHERKRLNIDNLKISLSKVLGYYIEIPNSKIQKASNQYIKKQALTNSTRYTTQKLSEFEQEIFNLKYKINEYEYKLYTNIKNQAKDFVVDIRELASEIAKIDVIASFARCALEYNLVRPKFNNDKIIIKNGYHPALLKLKDKITKNDTDIQNGSMIILTGANMSGKSTYLKHNALICLLAQIGSFVPADYADLTIVDKLFMRQDTSDDILNQNSSFMVEMNDLKFIVENVTDSSFVLLDEPAKSTNAKEGGAIARAFLEYLLKYYNTKVMIATHNLELTKLENLFPDRVFNYLVGEDNSNSFSHKIKRGIIKSSFALDTAILANLPNEIIENAKKYISL